MSDSQKNILALHIGWNYLTMEPYDATQTPRMLGIVLSRGVAKYTYYQNWIDK